MSKLSCQDHILQNELQLPVVSGVTVKGEDLPGKQVSVTGLSDHVGASGTVLLSPFDTLRLPPVWLQGLNADPGRGEGEACHKIRPCV